MDGDIQVNGQAALLDGGGLIGGQRDDAVLEAGQLQRFGDGLLGANDVDVDGGAHLLLGENQGAQTGAGHVVEVLHHQHEGARVLAGCLRDPVAEPTGGCGVQLAGEGDLGDAVLDQEGTGESHASYPLLTRMSVEWALRAMLP